MNVKMSFNQNISIKRLIVFLFIFESVIIYLFVKNTRNDKLVLKSFELKSTIDLNVCGKYIYLNEDMIELLRRDTKLDIILFIAEPQRLMEYLNEEQMRLFKISDNSTETISIPDEDFKVFRM